jgi:hypothetical protein
MDGNRFPIHACLSNHNIVKCAARGPGIWDSLLHDRYSQAVRKKNDKLKTDRNPNIDNFQKSSVMKEGTNDRAADALARVREVKD